MKLFLTAKHWQIFLLLLVSLVMSDFTYTGNLTITLVIRLIGLLIFLSWVISVGHGLYQYLLAKIDMNYSLFLINVFVFLAAYSVVIVLSDGDGMTFTGLAALPAFYVFYAFLHILAFPGRVLKSIELGKRAGFGEYIGNFFLIVFLPVGIWFLQPRVNKVVEANRHAIAEPDQ